MGPQGNSNTSVSVAQVARKENVWNNIAFEEKEWGGHGQPLPFLVPLLAPYLTFN